MTEESLYEMYRLMAIAKYDERYVIPKAHEEQAHDLEELGCSLDFDEGPGMYDSGSFGEACGRPVPVAVETFHALKQRQTSDEAARVRRPARPGQPAQLGRRRRPAGAVPAATRARERVLVKPDVRVVRQVASWCLSYPDEALVARVPSLRAALDEQPSGPATDPLRRFLDRAER